uniref:DUF6821 domain-containing protein n=1 Tax=Kalanchoe fedtschenkoi TaxID=63787 RepID=A0A7N0V1B6_KALFE
MVDLDDWEYLPDATYLLRHDEAGDACGPQRFVSKSVFNMDYFSTDSPPTLLIPTPQFVPHHLPTPTLLQPQEVPDQLLQPDPQDEDEDSSTVATQVFFKNNTEFVDMKLLDSSSPRSIPASTLIAGLSFEDKTDGVTTTTTITSPRKTLDLFNPGEIATRNTKNDVNWVGEGIIGDDYAIADDSGVDLWRLGLGGIGALCSFGFAAAAICLLVFGNNHKVRHNHHKLSFQIYASADDNKRMKQVVQQATKFNEAMAAAVRGVPLNRAHITYGGYYDNAL